MNYINDFHWIWYGIGFLFAPRLTIMIALSVYLSHFIPLPLMIIGWVIAILSFCCFGGNSK